MSRVIEDTIASMDGRARALLRRLHERDKDRHWNEPVNWPARTPKYEPADIWAQNKLTNDPFDMEQGRLT